MKRDARHEPPAVQQEEASVLVQSAAGRGRCYWAVPRALALPRGGPPSRRIPARAATERTAIGVTRRWYRLVSARAMAGD